MTEKSLIVSALGEEKLLLPSLVNAALTANDRVKYLFTLLQTARSHADHPNAPVSSLSAERLAAGVTDPSFDAAVAGAQKLPDGRYQIPRADAALKMIVEDLGQMLAPLVLAAGNQGGDFSARHQALADDPGLAELRTPGSDTLRGDSIEAMTSGDRGRGDSPHLLVMDMHKALNRLQVEVAGETIDGASAYDIRPGDRALIAAFMDGVAATRPLKFEHPGLATTATRVGRKLVLQNDIGTTDAHVLVVHVVGREVSVTYTDVHLPRLQFFQSLFKGKGALNGQGMIWEDTRARQDSGMESGVYHLGLGRIALASAQALRDFLRFLGSRLVFLIDWNRARKRLRLFLPKAETLALLKWAADENIGHMAFLKAGGETLVYNAMEFALAGRIHLGETLSDALGRERALEFMRTLFRVATRYLLDGRPVSLVEDEVKAELAGYVSSAQEDMLDIAVDHAGYLVELASGIRDSMVRARGSDPAQVLAANAERAKEWESRADELLNAARAAARRADGMSFFAALIESADDVADDLEDAAFNLTLSAGQSLDHGQSKIPPPLAELAGHLVQGAREYVMLLETARHIRRGGSREDTQDFLEAFHRIASLEHLCDDAQRVLKRTLLAETGRFAELYGALEAGRKLEHASDHLLRVAITLRDHIFGQVVAGG
ncbi:MAG: hypothetical protein B7Y41_07060 [Hydrogenophilales bacterium 28-61-23]|nr:MAG: hypothetical protein B7Y41_07060 [Hydrogenophilales bacterium 28-61-23]